MPSIAGKTRRRAVLSRAVLLACALSLLSVTSASAGTNWLDPSDLSKPGRDASNPAVAMDSTGNTVAIWERQSTTGPGFNLQVSTRAAGGTFTAPVDLAINATDPHLAMTPGGEAVAIWQHLENPPGNHTIQAATRPPGGSFSAPATIYMAPDVLPQEVELAVGAGGDVAVTWSVVDPESGFEEIICGIDPNTSFPYHCPNPSFVLASVRPAGGSFTPPKQISEPRAFPPGGATDEEKEEWEKAQSVKTAGAARPVVDPAGNTVVVFSYFDGEDYVVQSAVRAAGGDFTAPAQVSESGKDANSPEIGIDAAGNAIATWIRNEGSAQMVQAGIRAPGGGFVQLGNVSPPGGVSQRPVIGVAPNGTATIAWHLAGISESFVQSVTRPPGGTFTKPANVNSGNDNPLFHEIAVSDEGDAIVVWSGNNGTNEIVRAAVRPAGQSGFGSPVAISQSSPGFFHPKPAMDKGGDATVVWVRDNGTHNIVQMAGYDADPPELGNVSIPALATVGQTVQFSAAGLDVWQIGPPSFDFGDGAQAGGTSVSHVYSAPGSRTVTVTVKDSVGRESATTGTVLVKARNFFSFGKLSLNREKGTATLAVNIPEPGAIVTTGKRFKKVTVRSAKAGTVKILLKAVGRGLRRLGKKGKLGAQLKVAYSPIGGDTNTKRRKVILRKKLG
jgi:PKD repeat protein